MVQPRLVLHIGTEKTGTTSIQNFSYTNRKLLQEKYSILYPAEIGNQFGHTKIALLGYENSRNDDLTIANYNDSVERHKTRESWIQHLKTVVHESFCHTVFLSSEFFQSRLASTEDLVRLKNVLEPLFSKIEVVMYVRSPLNTALSLMSEAIKHGSTNLGLLPSDNIYINRICNHKLTCQMWSSVFCDANLVVKSFQKEYLYKGSVVDDIFYLIGLPDLSRQGLIVPGVENESLSLEGMYILSMLNKFIPKLVEGKINPTRQDLSAYISARFSSGSTYYPSGEEINSFKQKFFDSQQWIADNFWDGSLEPWGPSLSPDRSKHQNSLNCIDRMSSDDFASSLISCLGSVWIDKVGPRN